MCLKQDLNADFRRLWGEGNIVFDHAFSVNGEVFRDIKNRKTMRFTVDGKNYFIKIHRGVGWKEIWKNLFQLKRPVISAANEYLAIRRLEELHVETMVRCAFAERGRNPARRESFLVTEELKHKISLEDFCRNWKKNPPASSVKHRIIRELADVCARMHFSGLNHRDCYLCHFLLDQEKFAKGEISLCVLDLHRAEIRRKIPRRLQVKDVAGIFFSSMDSGITRRDALRFIAHYSSYGKLDRHFWKSVEKTAEKLYRKEFKRNPVLDVSFSLQKEEKK